MPANSITPLSIQVPIVDPKTGTPSPQFQRFMQQMQISWGNITGTVTGQTDLQAALDLKLSIYIGTGGFAGYTMADVKGLFAHSVTTGAYAGFDTNQTVGAFYAQNASGTQWFSFAGTLTPNSRFFFGGSHSVEFDSTPYVGTNVTYNAGNLIFGAGLTYNAGTGVLTASGGGGGVAATLGAPGGLLAGTATGTHNFYLIRRIFCDENMTINAVAFMTTAAAATCQYQPFIYNCSPAGVGGTLVASGAQVTGTTAGYNQAPLSTPANLVKGNFYFVGCSVITADIANIYVVTSGFSGIFVANGGSSVPAASCPATGTGGTLYAFWGVA